MVSFPDEFLAEVDRIAQEEHRSRSVLLREAVRLYIELRRSKRKPGDDPRVQQAVTAQDALARLALATMRIALLMSVADARHIDECVDRKLYT